MNGMAPHPGQTTASPATLVTVLGEIPAQVSGAVDAHSQIWIERVRGAIPDAPILDDPERILVELQDYRAAGGSAQRGDQLHRDGQRYARFAD